MKINIKKGNNRSQLICIRPDGTMTKADMGPAVPLHDIAHFVIENTLHLADGFYGNILKGYSIEQLGDKEIIKAFGAETMFSEIATRALQSLSSGACNIAQFVSLIKNELSQFSIHYTFYILEDIIVKMLIEYQHLIGQWNSLSDGDMLQLSFTLQKIVHWSNLGTYCSSLC